MSARHSSLEPKIDLQSWREVEAETWRRAERGNKLDLGRTKHRKTASEKTIAFKSAINNVVLSGEFSHR